MQDSLYVIRSEIGNQCSALRSGLVHSCLEDLRIYKTSKDFCISKQYKFFCQFHILSY